MGDFNATIGKQQDGENHVLGRHGAGRRNERGDRLVEFATSRNLYIANTKFHMKSKWTWRSPDGKTTNEIDFIINRVETVKDVQVINRVNVGSDHRMVRNKIQFQHKVERNGLKCRTKKAINLPKLSKMKEVF